MNFANLTSAHLRQAIKLLEQRDALKAKLAGLDQQLARISTGPAATPTGRGRKRSAAKPTDVAKEDGKPRGRGGKRGGKRGDLKTNILSALQSAGEEGVSIKDLAGKLGAKNANVHQWFATTGKKVTGLEKVSPGKYRLAAASTDSSAS